MEYGSRLANAAELSEPFFSVELREVCQSGALTGIQEINISNGAKYRARYQTCDAIYLH